MGEEEEMAVLDTQADVNKFIRQTIDVGIADEVFSSWIESSKSSSFDPRIKIDGRRYTRYYHHSIPYCSTIFDRTVDDDSCIGARWRNIKLCNDGFVYTPCALPIRPVLRHHDERWLPLNPMLKDLPSIVNYLDRFCGDSHICQLFYNYSQQRIDIKCRGQSSNKQVVERETPDKSDLAPSVSRADGTCHYL